MRRWPAMNSYVIHRATGMPKSMFFYLFLYYAEFIEFLSYWNNGEKNTTKKQS